MSWRGVIRVYKYKVIILPLAEKDIIKNVDYIAKNKKSQETARNLAVNFRKQIAGLEIYPQRHGFDENKNLAKLRVRKHYFKNYKIYYIVNEEEKTVYILRVLHMRMNSETVLLNRLKK